MTIDDVTLYVLFAILIANCISLYFLYKIMLTASTYKKVDNLAGWPEEDEEDDLYDDAVAAVVRAGNCSTSLLQRRFRIGYGRAAGLVDMLEERGVIGPADGSKPRKVLITGAKTK